MALVDLHVHRSPRGVLRGRPGQVRRPSEPMVDSAGTTPPLCAPHPLIACTVLLPLSHRQRSVARSTPDGPFGAAKPIASIDARW
eukprot:2767828-Prymnesium_polylepis.2